MSANWITFAVFMAVMAPFLALMVLTAISDLCWMWAQILRGIGGRGE